MIMEGSQGGLLLLKMVQSIQDNGSMASGTDSDRKCGQMVQNTKDSGKMTKPMGKENWCMLTEMSTKASG